MIGGGRCPIVDTWWQTETGAIMITPLPGITATKPGSATQPFPGIQAEVVDETDGRPVENGQGLLVIRAAVAVDAAHALQDDERFVETYFSRFGPQTYVVGDAARRDEDGYFWVIGRIDDVVNVSGHRLSTAEVESAIVAHEMVAEAAVIGQFDEQTGQAICAFVTLQGSVEGTAELEEGIRATVAERIGKFARPKRIVWADDLPKTRSGKIMRRLLRDIAEGRALGDVTTLRDPDVVERPASIARTGGSSRGRHARRADRAGHPGGRVDLAVAGPPAAGGVALEVLEDVRRLAQHHCGDLVEDAAQLLLGALGGAHLDHVAQRAQVRAPDDVGREADRREAAQRRGDLLLDVEGDARRRRVRAPAAASRWNSSSASTIASARSRTGSSAGGTRKPMSVRRT